MNPPRRPGFVRLLTLLGCWLFAGPAESQPLRVGVYHNPPKILAGAQGRPSGMFGDLLVALAREEGWQLEPVPCQWSQCLAMLEQGEIDLMPDVALTDERDRRFLFHQTPALLSWSQLYTAPGRRLDSLLELDGRRLAVLRDSVQQHYLTQLADSFGLIIHWLPVETLEEAFALLDMGRADVVAANHFIGDLKAREGSLNTSPIMFLPSKLYFALAPGRDPALAAAIDSHLQAWKQDGDSVYYRVLEQWSGLPDTALPRGLRWAILALLGLLALALAFTLLLRRKVAERTLALQASEQRLNTILDSVEACIYIKDEQLRYQYANRKVCELFGVARDQLIGRDDSLFFDTATRARLRENDLRVLEQGERVAREELNMLARGEQRSFISVKLPLRRPDGRVYALCGISTDITEYRQLQQDLHQLAFFDPLTGLANRRLLLDQLRRALVASRATGYQGALLLIDLDHFKNINDTQGHDCGDELLRQVAGRLRAALSDTDTAGRLGSDEFVLIREDLSTDPADALLRLRRETGDLLARLSEPYHIGSHSYNCGASIGIALFSDANGDMDALLKAADLAMFSAKADGRGTLGFFNQQMQQEVNRRILLETELRGAADRQQLALFLQPQVDAAGRITGMEGLLRWQHPTLGRVSPADFIPLAEHSGLIVPIGHWVLQQACDLLAGWAHHPALAGLGLSVNISARQFRHPGFVEDLGRLLAQSGANPARLELEITESLLIDDIEQTISRMEALGRLGVRFSLDDFGTGYASLGYLKRLPLSQLKIDQSFVRDLLTDPNDEAIVRTIIALGRSLDLQVIAEGVETAEQAERLRTLGCNAFQGYHFGRPEPAAHWRARLTGKS